MRKFKFWNTLCGWVVFAIAAATYLLTIEPTASFWDCGEFISSAWKLDVGHPPGAPFFMLMGHFASLFASEPGNVAMCVNALSALASAFCILFLFWTITALGRKLLSVPSGKLAEGEQPMSMWQGIALLGAGAVGALAYTFSDTFWFSAVEGEVYASSSLFTAVVFWLILKWDEKADEEGSDKWLILIAYLMGLSIGVHLLNLLTIPAIVLVYYFRKFTFSWKGLMLALLASVGILAIVLYGLIPGFVQVACWFELLFVNVMGLPFNTGVLVYIVLAIAALIWAIIETYQGQSPLRMGISFVLAVTMTGIPFFFESVMVGILFVGVLAGALYLWKSKMSARILNTAILMITVVLIGYSSYAAIVIRSSADTPMDQNSPDNVFSLKYYLNREQYGDRPLLYGQTYNAPVELEVKGNMCIPVEKVGHAQYSPAPKTVSEKDKYVVTGHKSSYKYRKEFMMLFPRMYSPDQRHIEAYKSWANVKGHKVNYDYCGQKKSDYVPTFAENLRFFFSYQVNYMYWRYFMWNFAGRQNDQQGYGEMHKGNWISGISALDNARLGDQDALPSELKNNKGHNVYYLLPLLLGILGMFYQLSKRDKGAENFTLTFLLFFLTGLAIVVYLNQTPYQPRERDYAYAGSFYAFCIWIGLGAMALAEWGSLLTKSKAMKSVIALVAIILTLGVPYLMANQNWDDHDRSNRYACRDFGANYLRSCEKNGIIFSNGDNDTFPLWYNQEVEGEGTDLRVCNLSYLQTDWYIGQMKRPYYESPALPISWEEKDFMPGTNEVVWVDSKMQQPISVKTAFDFIRSSDPRTKRPDGENYIPTTRLFIPIDAEQVMTNSTFAGQYEPEQIAERIEIPVSRRLTRSEMMVLEMLSTNQWQRPMYFAVTVGDDYFQGLKKYFEFTGLAYQITPVASPDGQPRVNIEKMYDNMMHKFRYGGMNTPGVYIDENLMRMCRTHRMMFAELSEALLNAGDKERAVEVLDYAEQMLPECNIPYDYTSASMGVAYIRSGEREKGLAMLSKVAEGSAEYLHWSETLSRDQLKATQRTIGHQTAVLGFVLQHCQRIGAADIMEQYYPIYEKFAR